MDQEPARRTARALFLSLPGPSTDVSAQAKGTSQPGYGRTQGQCALQAPGSRCWHPRTALSICPLFVRSHASSSASMPSPGDWHGCCPRPTYSGRKASPCLHSGPLRKILPISCLQPRLLHTTACKENAFTAQHLGCTGTATPHQEAAPHPATPDLQERGSWSPGPAPLSRCSWKAGECGPGPIGHLSPRRLNL